MNSKDEAFEHRAKAALDASVGRLDAGTRRHLVALRAHALEHKPFLSRWLSLDNWIPATAFAACAVLAVILIISPAQQKAPDQLALQDTDMVLELLLNEDTREELVDPDFYVWLDAELLESEERKNAG